MICLNFKNQSVEPKKVSPLVPYEHKIWVKMPVQLQSFTVELIPSTPHSALVWGRNDDISGRSSVKISILMT